MLLIFKLNLNDFEAYSQEYKKCLIHNCENTKIKKVICFIDLEIKNLPTHSKLTYVIKRGISTIDAIEYSKRISKEERIIYMNPFFIFSTELNKIELNNQVITNQHYTIFFRNTKYTLINDNPTPSSSVIKYKKEITINSVEEKQEIIRKKGEIVVPKESPLKFNRLDIIIISVNYNDYLLTSLSENIKVFENITVVTSSDDIMCQKICEKFGVNVVITDRMYENGAIFNKGKAINDGIISLPNPDWILLLDADIVVNQRIDVESLNIDTLYTSSRWICNEYNRYKNWKEGNIEITSIGSFEESRGLGFFQLFNFLKEKTYPETSDDAAWSDLMFRDKFPKRQKIENIVIHLGNAYKNWEGRKTQRFLTDDEFHSIFTKKSTYTICSYYFNFRNDIRQKENFIKFLKQFDGHYDKMIVGIVDYGDIDFEIPCKSIVIKGDSEKRIWSKEILINKIIDEIDTDYLIWIDGDLIYEDLSWLDNIDSVVKGNNFVQLFETINYLGENGEVLETHKSIMSSGRSDIDNLLGEGYKPGGAWLGKTSILKEKKLFEQMYVGGGDTIFVYGLFRNNQGWTIDRVREGSYKVYRESKKWIENFISGKVGYFNASISHLFHGILTERNYNNRYNKLSDLVRKNEIVVYTCISGGYDNLKEIINPEPEVDYICFTDDIKLHSETWDIKILPGFTELLNQTKKARCIKVLPHLFLSKYKTSVWIDGNIEIIGNIKELISENLKNYFAIP